MTMRIDVITILLVIAFRIPHGRSSSIHMKSAFVSAFCSNSSNPKGRKVGYCCLKERNQLCSHHYQSPQDQNDDNHQHEQYEERNRKRVKQTRRSYILDQWGAHIHNPIHHDPTSTQQQQQLQTAAAAAAAAAAATPTFPHSFELVSTQAFHAIACTLYNTGYKLDPNIASNAMSKSVLHYRPVKHPTRDVGRIGLEIDGARYLTTEIAPPTSSSSSSSSRNGRRSGVVVGGGKDSGGVGTILHHNSNEQAECQALRRFSLMLASKLSQAPWDIVHEQFHPEDHHDEDERKHTRPVAIYFNTLQLTLLASQELTKLKKAERDEYFATHPKRHGRFASKYENIQICCLGQDGLPPQMTITTNPKHERNHHHRQRKSKSTAVARRKHLFSGEVDPQKGIALVVQPTEHGKTTYHPSSRQSMTALPSSLNALQTLAVASSTYQIPLVVLSPRLISTVGGTGSSSSYSMNGGIHGSGYERSSTYGGREPARPTPWLMRDFTPPVFAWVGCAASTALVVSRGTDGDDDGHARDVDGLGYSRVALTHSIMDLGHPWHLFAVRGRRYMQPALSSSKNKNKNNSNKEYRYEHQYQMYQYLASTMPSSGRPSQDIINAVLQEWTDMSSTAD